MDPHISVCPAVDDTSLPPTPHSRKRKRATAAADTSPTAVRRSRRLGHLEPNSTDGTMSSAPTESTTTFPFLRLPAELRLHIYRVALLRTTPLLLHHARPAAPSSSSSSTYPSKSETLIYHAHVPRRRATTSRHHVPATTRAHQDPLPVALLRASRLVYTEARQVLYAENAFALHLHSGIASLSMLHQRSRSLIKAVTLRVPSHHDIVDGFADLVRLGLRYCWGLRKFLVLLEGAGIDAGVGVSAYAGAASAGASPSVGSVYGTAFSILRFLPRGCEVFVRGEGARGVGSIVLVEGIGSGAGLMRELDGVGVKLVFG